MVLLLTLAVHAQNSTPLCPDDNHPHAIDLGLPSARKWACCNVGAYSPFESGGYYAWGETQTKSTYDNKTYRWLDDMGYKYVKEGDGKGTLDPSDDAAHVNMGGSWHIPTHAAFRELWSNTDVRKVSVKGVKGIRFKSRTNGNSIFLPQAGMYKEAKLEEYGVEGDYWTSNPDWSSNSHGLWAHQLRMGYDSMNTYLCSRQWGLCVRAVIE